MGKKIIVYYCEKCHVNKYPKDFAGCADKDIKSISYVCGQCAPMSYEKLVERKKLADVAVKDCDFSKCIDCTGEEYISLKMNHPQEYFRLALSSSSVIVTTKELRELQSILNELFPGEETS